MASENNNGTIFMLVGGAALLYWFMSQQSDDAIGGTLSPIAPNAGATQPPAGASVDTKGPLPVPKTDPPAGNPQTSDPLVPLPGLLVRIAGTGSQNVDEWNYHYQMGVANGAQQPDPLTFLPEGFDRSQNMSATDYVRYRGLGRVASARYVPQASRIIRQSNF